MPTIPEYIEIKTPEGYPMANLSPDADGLKDVWIDNELNGPCTLSFWLPLDSPKWQYLNDFHRIVAGGREFIILNPDVIERKRDGKKLYGKLSAPESWVLLGKKYTTISNDPQTPNPPTLAVIILSGGSDLSGGLYAPGTAAHALYAVLQGTGWALGTVDVTGIHDLETEKESILANINKIQEIWGGYLVWDSINKTVSLRDEEKWREYTGYQIRYAKNLKNITRTDDYDIVTKLYPFGENDLNIASVNEGREYIENYIYTSEELVGIWHNQDIADPAELKSAAEKHLAKICRPRFNYKVSHVDLRTLPGYSHEEFDIGHIVDIIDEELNKTFTFDYDAGDEYDSGLVYADWYDNQARVIRYRYNVFQPWLCDLEVGDPLEKIDSKLASYQSTTDYVKSIKNSKDQIAGGKLVNESVIKEKIARAAVDATKMDAKVVILVGDEWTDNSPGSGYVSWNQHKLYYAGKEYNINAGSTNQKYIYWDGESENYSSQGIEPDLEDGQFYIAVNNSGVHDLVWNSPTARKFIGSLFIGDAAILTAHIADLAVTDAKIANLSANKIIAETLSAITANLGTVTSGEIYSATFSTKAPDETKAYAELLTDGSFNIYDIATRLGLQIWGGNGQGTIAWYLSGISYAQASINAGTYKDLWIRTSRSETGISLDCYNGVELEVARGGTNQIEMNTQMVHTSNHLGVGGDCFVTGELIVFSGVKNAAEVTEEYGILKLPARESPEPKYTDEGLAYLVDGQCKVQIDPKFIACVEPNVQDTPWLFKLTPMADISLYVAEVGPDYFIVKSKGGEKISGPFCWFITGVRKGFAGWRFKEIPIDDEVLTNNWEDELLNE